MCLYLEPRVEALLPQVTRHLQHTAHNTHPQSHGLASLQIPLSDRLGAIFWTDSHPSYECTALFCPDPTISSLSKPLHGLVSPHLSAWAAVEVSGEEDRQGAHLLVRLVLVHEAQGLLVSTLNRREMR